MSLQTPAPCMEEPRAESRCASSSLLMVDLDFHPGCQLPPVWGITVRGIWGVGQQKLVSCLTLSLSFWMFLSLSTLQIKKINKYFYSAHSLMILFVHKIPSVSTFANFSLWWLVLPVDIGCVWRQTVMFNFNCICRHHQVFFPCRIIESEFLPCLNTKRLSCDYHEALCPEWACPPHVYNVLLLQCG